jgi:hypothetical protein
MHAAVVVADPFTFFVHPKKVQNLREQVARQQVPGSGICQRPSLSSNEGVRGAKRRQIEAQHQGLAVAA